MAKFLRGFTLIELLVVLAIVGILMSLLFPAVNGALNTARKASAQNDVVQIANSLTMYQTEYGRWPTSAQAGVRPLTGPLLTSALMAQTTNENSRRIVFLEVPDFKRNRGGFTNDSYLDPWGNTYQVVIDTLYSNTLSFSAGNNRAQGSTNVTLRKTVASFNVTSSTANRSDSNYFGNVVYSW